jgi:tetratricopeptide (TPR) repeat protein
MMGHEARLGLVLGLSVAAWAYPLSVAEAAPQRKDTGPLFTQVDTGQAAAANARALAAKGQCDKALAAFDQALRSTIDMSIRRDRGLCHEALGHPFPAMDDYRAYLAWRPDAPDGDDIRARLDRLEAATGTGGPSPNQVQHKSAEDVPDEPALADESAPGTTDNGKRNGIIRRTYDEEESKYRRFDQALSSPLRRGSGGIFGVYSDFRDWSAQGNSVPNIEVGAAIRWSFDPWNSLYGQVGYVDYFPSGFGQVGSAEGANFGGLALGLGYEFRLRLDENATHNLLFGALVEYQRVTQADINTTLNLMIPEGKVGYRLILGYGFGLEFTGELGTAIVLNSPVTAEGVYGGGSFAVLLAF